MQLKFGKRQRLVALYAITLVMVCASVMVGPAVSGELILGNFNTPNGTNAPSGNFATGNGTDQFVWNDATFQLIDDNLIKMSIGLGSCSSSALPCDKDVFTGEFTGTGWNPALDTLTLSLTGTHTSQFNLTASLLLDDDQSASTLLIPLIYPNSGGGTINLTTGPLAVPYESFLATLTLETGEWFGTFALGNSADALFTTADTGVPEPASVFLLAGGLAVLAYLRRKINSME